MDAEHIGDLAPAVFSSAARQSFVTGVAQGRGRAILAKLTNERAWRRCRCRLFRGTHLSRWLRGRHVPVCGPFSRATNAIAQQN